MEQILSLSLWSITTVSMLVGNHSESRSLTDICFTRCQCFGQLAQHNQLLLGARQRPAPTCFAKLFPHFIVVKKLSLFLRLTQTWLSSALQLPVVVLNNPRLFMFYKTQVFYKISTLASVILTIAPQQCCKLQCKFIIRMLSSNCDGVTLRHVFNRRINKYWKC